MESRNKVIRIGENDELSTQLHEAIVVGARDERMATALRKDAMLVEAALQTGRVIISSDVRARDGFHRLAARMRSLRTLRWLDPVTENESVQAWLKAGK